MDIVTLKAVIAKLEQEIDHCHEMIKWAFSKQEEMGGERDINMWCDCKVQAKRSLDIVQNMLDAALLEQEAA